MSERLCIDCRLAADIMEQCGTFPTAQGILRDAAEAIATKDAEIARLREALEWYASDEAWTIEQVEGAYGDYGARARAALSPIPDPAGGMPVEVE